MKSGYVTFFIVLVGILILFALLEMQMAWKKADYSQALLIERTYGVEMNVKEIVLELLRQGARDGFTGYDDSHKLISCAKCPESFCMLSPPLPPADPHACDLRECNENCFRDQKARENSTIVALLRYHILDKPDQFDPDFNISFPEEPDIEVVTKIDPTAKNGYSLDYVRFKNPFEIIVTSEKFGMIANSTIPRDVRITDFGFYNN